jgi:hypothetical protein
VPVHRHYLSLALLLIVGTGTIFAAPVLVFAQDRPHLDHGQHVDAGGSAVPVMPGQEAFGTIQEIVRMLEADPATDWSRVGALDDIAFDACSAKRRTVQRARPTGGLEQASAMS